MPATAYCSLYIVGVPLAHGQFITVLFNLFVTFVHLLPTCILYYVYLMLLAIGPNKVFLIPDSSYVGSKSTRNIAHRDHRCRSLPTDPQLEKLGHPRLQDGQKIIHS